MSNVTALKPGHASTDYSNSQIALIQRTLGKDLSPDEFNVFIEMSRRFGLSPMQRQIYAVVYNANKPDKRKVSYITSIDGYRAIAARSNDYKPDPEAPRIVCDEKLKSTTNPEGIEYAEVSVCRYIHGDWHAFPARAYWSEFAPLKTVWKDRKPTDQKQLGGKWGDMPRIMISKCAEAQALRKGWPEDLSSLYAQDEMDQADALDLNATEIVENHEQELREKRITGGLGFIFELTEGIVPTPIGQVYDRCAEFTKSIASANLLHDWKVMNRHPLNEFWAQSPTDALALKKHFEALEAELEKAEAEASAE